MNGSKTLFAGSFVLLMLVAASPILGQGRGFMRTPSFTRLLMIEEVQKELGLEGDTFDAAMEYAEDAQAKMREEMQMIRDQGLDDAETRAEISSLSEQMLAQDGEALAKILSADQMKRLKQLLLQQQGAAGATSKEVAEAIGLSEDERVALKSKIDELNAESMEKMREIFQNGGDRDEFQKAMADSRKRVEEIVLEVLTDDQEKKFVELKGVEFKFPEPDVGGQRRRDF
jgi:hypothetical protein